MDARPRHVYDARLFWVVEDTDGACWRVALRRPWAARQPYRGRLQEFHRVDRVTERLLLQRWLADGPDGAPDC